MSLFSKGSSQKVEVKPSKEVENILRSVVSETENMPETEFIKRQAANLDPEARAAVQRLADSGQTKQAISMLSPRMAQGLQQVADNNKYLQNQVDNPVSIQGILTDKKALQSGLNANVLSQGLQMSKGLQGNKAALRAYKLAGNSIRANNALNQGNISTNLAIRNQLGQREGQINALENQNRIGAANTQLGLQGAGLAQQATANQLQAGNVLQGIQQNQNNVDWYNQNAEKLQGWSGIMDKLNVMNQVSNLAGYSSTQKQPGTPIGQQIAGAGLMGLGIAGQMGAFNSASPFAGLNQSQTNQAYNSGLASSGGFAGVDTPMNYQANQNSVNAAARAQGGGQGFWNTNLGQGMQSGYNTVKGWF